MKSPSPSEAGGSPGCPSLQPQSPSVTRSCKHAFSNEHILVPIGASDRTSFHRSWAWRRPAPGIEQFLFYFFQEEGLRRKLPSREAIPNDVGPPPPPSSINTTITTLHTPPPPPPLPAPTGELILLLHRNLLVLHP